jgi:hypothetical protein
MEMGSWGGGVGGGGANSWTKDSGMDSLRVAKYIKVTWRWNSEN